MLGTWAEYNLERIEYDVWTRSLNVESYYYSAENFCYSTACNGEAFLSSSYARNASIPAHYSSQPKILNFLLGHYNSSLFHQAFDLNNYCEHLPEKPTATRSNLH